MLEKEDLLNKQKMNELLFVLTEENTFSKRFFC